MNLSYWEYDTWFSQVDFTIVGSGIVGLNCALALAGKYPKAKILVLEQGVLPQGASTKNAGFACFGSISELLSDLKEHSEQDVVQLVKQRWEGIQILRNTLGDKQIDYQHHGGYEIFLNNQTGLYETCLGQIAALNALLKPVFKKAVFKKETNRFGFKGVKEHYISHAEEAQIHTGKMMHALLRKVQKSGVSIVNNVSVKAFEEHTTYVLVQTQGFEFKTGKLLIATNGFASKLLAENVQPARAQVLITKPIKNLQIKGTFHLQEGYYYFRNIEDRILLGGGRNLDFKGEETMVFGETRVIQNRLENLLAEVLLPDVPFEIAHRWSGIMGMGVQKKPILQQVSNHVYCGVRLGGMGIAIGSTVGKELAALV